MIVLYHMLTLLLSCLPLQEISNNSMTASKSQFLYFVHKYTSFINLIKRVKYQNIKLKRELMENMS